jgi:hypothetical protein
MFKEGASIIYFLNIYSLLTYLLQYSLRQQYTLHTTAAT